MDEEMDEEMDDSLAAHTEQKNRRAIGKNMLEGKKKLIVYFLPSLLMLVSQTLLPKISRSSLINVLALTFNAAYPIINKQLMRNRKFSLKDLKVL